ncbi:MAG: hypothetical protein D3922_15540, partial [Candidatus Electrothrix sp. AR1]|nr:hypothetical protein [Candidatus Electrothrix sp. AR1]
ALTACCGRSALLCQPEKNKSARAPNLYFSLLINCILFFCEEILVVNKGLLSCSSLNFSRTCDR